MRIYHYTLDCQQAEPGDTLAVTTDEAMSLVNCQSCILEMQEQGYFDEEEPYPIEDYDEPDYMDMYWSGTGESMGDNSYTDYLNRY